MKRYAYFAKPESPLGVEKSRTDTMASGMHMVRSQILALPSLEWVLSTMRPIRMSEKPSNSLETAMMVLMAAAS